ncbi:hypothetical protein HF086_008288 [Spodoptera exigua]|uniref:Replication factor C subunit 1 n=1 Tax=Spodoptera exigua TaxID=7107 RepID=A0A922MD23_SPOEX|nr:hypothetical protein HF086_008288 [Spodoptera exigua]
MSRDIRSFFQPKKPPKPATAVDDDDDVIPESPDVQIIKNKKKESKKRRVIDDDSDEEIFTSKKKKNESSTEKTGQTSSKNKSKSPKPALKEVKVIDMFGNAPIKRTEPLVKKKKKTELGIHSDDEFEKSLLEIDNAELEGKINDDKVSNDDKVKPSSEKATSSKLIEEPNKESKTSHDKKHKSTSEVKKDEHKSSKSEKAKSEESKESKHKSDESKESRHKLDDTKTKKQTKDDKKPNHTSTAHSNDGESKKSKIENSKRKFAEFVDDDVNEHGNKKKKVEEQEQESKHKYDGDSSVMDESMEAGKKRKMNKSLNESALTDEERHERRMHSAALYKNYLNRSGPKHLGAKEIPEGKPDCLKDCAFLLTGVLDSFEKDEVAAAITKYGGCVKSGVSKKVTHVIAGEDAGPAKMAKAQELGIKIINEDEFLKMIVDRSQENHTSKPEIKKEIKQEKTLNKSKSKSPKDKKDNHVDKSRKSPDRIKPETKVRDKSNDSKKPEKFSPKKIKEEKVEASSSSTNRNQVNNIKKEVTAIPENTNMWVEKYKPQSIKQIIGQHGDASNVKKLMNWLTKWYVNRKAKLLKPSPWAKNDDGGYYKAALLSGPPGVGKTTSVALVCKELGFDMVEFNASDTRNKTLIKEQIGQLLTSTSLSAFANGETGKQAVTKKHVLVMDEVDGMAGNEDRGGLQELIGLIKSSSVPIICMCNDRQSQKMRSLVNYCYDLRFNRPRVDQIKSAMLSICFKEGIKIPPDVLSQLIVSANQDVRQTLNLLSMWAIDPSRADPDSLRKDAQTTKKDIKLAMYSSVIPGNRMSGHMTGQIQFPAWLGKNSRATKMKRLCQEIHAHTRLSTSGSKSSVYLDYSMHLRNAILNPLVKDKLDGVDKSLEVLESYHLLREDLDSLVKAAMTRSYNKKATALPYAPGAVKKGRAKADDEFGEDDQEDEEETNDSDPENDALIKKKKSKDAEKPTTSKGKSTSKASTSKKKKEK